jgi:hypothetical protein
VPNIVRDTAAPLITIYLTGGMWRRAWVLMPFDLSEDVETAALGLVRDVFLLLLRESVIGGSLHFSKRHYIRCSKRKWPTGARAETVRRN